MIPVPVDAVEQAALFRNCRICALHFHSSALGFFCGKRCVVRGAVPTVFNTQIPAAAHQPSGCDPVKPVTRTLKVESFGAANRGVLLEDMAYLSSLCVQNRSFPTG
jgi:hypothetical protein